MTVAVMTADYRVTNKDCGLDWSDTISTLELAGNVLKRAVARGP